MLCLGDKRVEPGVLCFDLKSAVEATHKEADRYSMREIKWVPQIDVAATQKQMEDFSRRIRELNVLIQETNWRVEI